MMSGSRPRFDVSDSDSSDIENLPVFNVCRRTQNQAQKPNLVVMPSSDSEIAQELPPAFTESRNRCGAVMGDIHMVSSDSEDDDDGDEAVFIPLAVRLKQKQAATVVSSSAETDQAKLPHHYDSYPTLSLHPSSSSGSSSTKRPFPSAPLQPVANTGTGLAAPRHRYAPSSGTDPFFTGGESGSGNLAKPKRKPVEIQAREEALRRRAERERQQEERERVRAEKKALADATKALRPEECLKHMVVSVDPALLQLEGGGTLLTSLQALGCSCSIETQPLPRSVTWSRRTPCPQTGKVLSIPESHTIVHVPLDEFVCMIYASTQEQRGGLRDGGPLLTSWTLRLQARDPRRVLSLAVIDVENYFRSQKSKSQRMFRQAVLGEDQSTGAQPGGKRRKRRDGGSQLPEVSRVDMEEALVQLQLTAGVQVRFLPTWKDFSDYVAMSTKAVAEAPFKRERERTGFTFCVESEWAGGQRVDRAGKGLLQAWRRQIQQLNRVSADMANAVLSAYPSPQTLVKAYAQCHSEREKIGLLSDILIRRGEGVTSTTRRIGPELAKRIYLTLTSPDPHQTLDSTA